MSKIVRVANMDFDLTNRMKISVPEFNSIKKACERYRSELVKTNRFVAIYTYKLKGETEFCDLYVYQQSIPMLKRRMFACCPVGMDRNANDFLFTGLARPADATEEDVRLACDNVGSKWSGDY